MAETDRGVALIVYPKVNMVERLRGSLEKDGGFAVEIETDLEVASERLKTNERIALLLTYHHITNLPRLGCDFNAEALVKQALAAKPPIPVVTFHTAFEGDLSTTLPKSERIPYLFMPFDTALIEGLGDKKPSLEHLSLLVALKKAGFDGFPKVEDFSRVDEPAK